LPGFAVACVLGSLALAVAGCGTETHVNNPRPQAPAHLSVTISDHAVTVQPTAVGFGPERSQQIPQNQHAPQPRIKTKAPMTVVFVSANLTDFDSHLEIRGPKDVSSGPLYANANGTFQAELPTGRYTISAADIPDATPAKLTVGPYRASSQNDVLLP
jgi:hypothetical protein